MDLANQLSKVYKKFHRVRSIAATSNKVKVKNVYKKSQKILNTSKIKYLRRKTCLAYQLYKVLKKFHRGRSVTATPRRVKDKKCGQTYRHFFNFIIEVGSENEIN